MSKQEPTSVTVLVVDGKLVPADQWAQERLAALPLKRRLEATFDLTEPVDDLRAKYMAGMNELFENIDGTGPGKRWPTMKTLRKHILVKIGFAEPLYRNDGVKMIPLSMARGEMDYADLQQCLELTRAYVVDTYGWDPWEEHEDAHR